MFRPRPGVTSVRVGDAVVVSDYEVYITLNDVSGRIWELIGAERSVGEIIARLLEEYDVAAEVLGPDVFAAIDRMLEARLIEPMAR